MDNSKLIIFDGENEYEVKGNVVYNPPFKSHDDSNSIKHKHYGKIHAEYNVGIREVVDIIIYEVETSKVVFERELKVKNGFITLPDSLELDEDIEYQMVASIVQSIWFD